MKNPYRDKESCKEELWDCMFTASLHHHTPDANERIKWLICDAGNGVGISSESITEVVTAFGFSLRQYLEVELTERIKEELKEQLEKDITNKIRDLLFKD